MNRHHTSTKFHPLVVAIVSTIMAVACGEAPPETTPSFIKLTPSARILDTEVGVTVLTVEADAVTVELGPGARPFGVGDVVVSSAGTGGLLRRVVAVRGPRSATRLSTDRAALTDLIADGQIHLEVPIRRTPAPAPSDPSSPSMKLSALATSSHGQWDLSGTTMYSNTSGVSVGYGSGSVSGDVDLSLTTATASFDAVFTLDLTIANQVVTAASYALAGNVKADVVAKLVADGTIELSGDQDLLPASVMIPFSTVVSGVPVVGTIHVNVEEAYALRMNGEAAAQLASVCSAAVSLAGTYSAKKGWNHHKSHAAGGCKKASASVTALDGDMELEISLRPYAQVYLYSVVPGPSVGFKVYAVQTTSAADACSGTSQLRVGVEPNAKVAWEVGPWSIEYEASFKGLDRAFKPVDYDLSVCGDGLACGPKEQCDGQDLKGASCLSLGSASGVLACGSGCTFDMTSCQGGCPAGNVCTIAGLGQPGLVDGPAATAQFSTPHAVAVDSDGTIYVADHTNHMIRAVKGGVVSVLAGTGTAGCQDGPAATAQLNYPHDVKVGPQGVYVADTYCNRVRLIHDGMVSTVAGSGQAGSADGPCPLAGFFHPTGLALLGGSVYVVDTDNHRVRVIQGGLVATVAGSIPGFADGPVATALFRHPRGIAVDALGRLYVTDFLNHAIRRIAGGMVTTVAGTGGAGWLDGPTGVARFSHPYGIAVAANNDLFVADQENWRIRLISGGVVTTLAGSGNKGFADGPVVTAEFNYPTGVALGPTGNVYVADAWNHRIRVVAR